MLNEVFIMGKSQFNKLMESNDLTDINVEAKGKNIALISINDTLGGWSEPWFKEDHANVLRLWFDDVENDLQVSPTNRRQCKAFTEEQAKQVVEFIDRNKDKNFIVHCAAGISRSGAVGRFISDYLGTDKDRFKNMNPHILPNSHVSRLLHKVLWERS